MYHLNQYFSLSFSFIYFLILPPVSSSYSSTSPLPFSSNVPHPSPPLSFTLPHIILLPLLFLFVSFLSSFLIVLVPFCSPSTPPSPAPTPQFPLPRPQLPQPPLTLYHFFEILLDYCQCICHLFCSFSPFSVSNSFPLKHVITFSHFLLPLPSHFLLSPPHT